MKDQSHSIIIWYITAVFHAQAIYGYNTVVPV